MPTTGSNFVEITGTGPVLIGSTVVTPPAVVAVDPVSALNLVNSAAAPGLPSSPGVPLDRIIFDLALRSIPPGVGATFMALGKFVGGFAKNGCALLTLVTTTAQNIDLTNLAAGTPTGSAGDLTYATVSCLIFNNQGAQDLVLSPGGSNPANFPKFTGTTPTISVPAGGVVCLYAPTPLTVDGTHKILTITPTAGGILAVAVGGA